MFRLHQAAIRLYSLTFLLPSGIRRICARALALLFVGIAPGLYSQTAVPSQTILPNRYLVVYRNAAISGDAELRARSLGTHLVHRNERFGIATLQADPGANDAATVKRLTAQPNVEYVLHDRLVAGHRVILQPLATALSSEPAIPALAVHAAGPTSHLERDTPTIQPIAPPPAPSPLPVASDTAYNSPDGWAVRQVGGYGRNTPGGPAHGPWDTTTGAGVRIAILDSGIDATHPDLAPNLALNLSEVSHDPITGLPSPCDDGTPQDQQGHGTWAASLAAAAAGPHTGDLIGVAPSATLLNIKVLQRMTASSVGNSGQTVTSQCAAGQAAGLLSWVIQGIEDAMANHADIISMSLGTLVDLNTGEGAGLKATFDRITYAAAQSGIILIAAAGNDGLDLTNPRYIELPAQARNVLTIVASTNPACMQNLTPGATCNPGPATLAYYTNYGTNLNALSAPGGSYPVATDANISGWIRGACTSGLPNTTEGPPSDSQHSFACFNLGHTPYVQAMGTSASAPLAAGAAALLRAAHPTWSASQIITTLRTTATTQPTLSIPQITAANLSTKP